MSIKIRNTDINIFKLKNNEIEILDNKNLNFVYANNGVGKTVLTNHLIEKFQDKYIKLSIHNDNISFFDASSFVFKPNINEINKNKTDLKNICFTINDNILKSLKNLNIFKTKPVWTKLLSIYLKNKQLFIIEKIITNHFLSKIIYDIDENIVDTNIFNDLYEFRKYLDNNHKSNNALTMDTLVDYDYMKIKENFERIKKTINDKKNELSDELLRISRDFKNIDINILEKIYSSILSIEWMNECYICENKIENFNEVKKRMQLKINEYKKQIINVVDIQNSVEYFSKILEKSLFYEDPFNYLELLTQKIIQVDNTIINVLHEIFEKKDYDNLDKLQKIHKEVIEKEKESLYTLSCIKEKHFMIIKEIVNNLIGENRLSFDFNDIKNFIKIDKIGKFESELPLSSGEKSLLNFIFNLFIAIAKYKNDMFIIIDDPNDYFDDKNCLNMYYLLKMAIHDYNLKFIIFTHNDNIVNYMYKSNEVINLQILYKNDNDEREVRLINNDEVQFLSFASGIETITKIMINIKNV